MSPRPTDATRPGGMRETINKMFLSTKDFCLCEYPLFFVDVDKKKVLEAGADDVDIYPYYTESSYGMRLTVEEINEVMLAQDDERAGRTQQQTFAYSFNESPVIP